MSGRRSAASLAAGSLAILFAAGARSVWQAACDVDLRALHRAVMLVPFVHPLWQATGILCLATAAHKAGPQTCFPHHRTCSPQVLWARLSVSASG